MREEYTGREISVDAVRPLLDAFANATHPARAMPADVNEAERISWERFCELLDDFVASTGTDPASLGALGISSRAYKYRRRLVLASRLFSLEDALRFVLYPRNPIDFSCVSTAVSSEPGRVDLLLYVDNRYAPSETFFQVARGAGEELLRLIDLPDGRMGFHMSGAQAHLAFTYTETTGLLTRLGRWVGRLISGIALRLVVMRSYPDLVSGRKMFEAQLIERAKAQARLNAAEQAFERRIGHVDEIIVEFDHRGELRYASPNVTRLTGAPGAPSWAALLEMVHADDVARLQRGVGEWLSKGQPARIDDFRVFDATGELRWVEIRFTRLDGPDGEPGTIAVLRDVTERRMLEEDRKRLDHLLDQTQRLEVLGVLAGGIAHDFNNLLMPIVGESELAELQFQDQPQIRDRVSRIRMAADKAADLVRQMMVYAGGKPTDTAAVDLASETRDLLELMRTSMPPNATLDVQLAESAVVTGDASQLRQVIMNLILNAAEAVGDEPGLVEVSVQPDGEKVRLVVRDNGCGMDERVRDHAFEPFYSTKFAGRGLGLSAAIGIVRAHAGELSVSSDPGVGSEFTVHLPAAGETSALETEKDEHAGRFSGTVLVVDDDADVRETARNLLETLGFDVETAADGEEAMAMIARPRYVAILLDLVMPRLDGKAVLLAVRRTSPTLPVVLMSGFRPPTLASSFSGDPYTRFLSKPYQSRQLANMLIEVGVATIADASA